MKFQSQIVQSQIDSSSWKILIPLFLVFVYWFYLSICCGYFLSKVFYNVFNIISSTSFSEKFKSVKFRKKFNLKNIIKIIIDFFWELIKNWFKRISQKTSFLISAVDGLIRAVKISLKKFKSPLKFKYNFRLLKILLPIFWETFLIFCSLFNEIFFLNKLKNWISQWKDLIRLFMEESILITGIVYGLYLIFLGIFGLILGVLLHLYRQYRQLSVSNKDEEIYLFVLLLLLKILYDLGFNDILFNPLRELCFDDPKSHNIEKFFKFHPQVSLRPSQLFLEEYVEKSEIPFPILGDPLFLIDVNFLFEESTIYEFELFKFYLDVNQKIKS